MYPQKITQKLVGQILIVDVSCVTGIENNHEFKLCYYRQIQDELRQFFEFPRFVGIADASLRRRIDDPHKYQHYIETGWIHEVMYADHYMLTLHQRKSGEEDLSWVVSNDKFRDFELPAMLRARIIEFHLIEQELIIYNQELLRRITNNGAA